MIARVWYAWTKPEQADAYERFLRDDIFPALRNRSYDGLRGLDLLRRSAGLEIEFVTIIWFNSLDNVCSFAGADYERAVVADEDRRLLSRFSEHVHHFDVSASARF